jgi:predicted outer membrane repeat protein
MLLPSWLRSGPNTRKGRAGRLGQRRARVRLTLESLEDRTAPAVLTVTSAADTHQDGLLTLREAVILANADAGSGQSDTIAFDPTLGTATVTLTGGQLELTQASSSGTVLIDGAGRITVSGNHASRVLKVDAGARAEIDGLTIVDGRVHLGSPNAGGGIANAGTLTVADCTLSGNVADRGGGIYSAGTLTARDCTLTGNTTFEIEDHGGGAIANAGTATITGCTITDNMTGNVGGGLLNEGGSMTVRDSTVTGNSVGYGGGGLENDFGTLMVEGCTIASNFGGGVGGGIENCQGTLTVTGSTFADNVTDADGGGGIANYGGYGDGDGQRLHAQCRGIPRRRHFQPAGHAHRAELHLHRKQRWYRWRRRHCQL